MWRGRDQGGGRETTGCLVSVGLTVSDISSSLLTSLPHSRLSDALKNTGFADALKAAGLDTGTGSDGVLPTRMARQTEEGAACTAILDDWKAFNTSGDKAVPGVGGDLDETETKNTIATLDKLNNK